MGTSKGISLILNECLIYNNLAWIEGFAIFLAVFIVVFVGSYNDYKKEEQFLKLYALDQEGKNVSVGFIIPGFYLFSRKILRLRHP
jgi:hypothetical protein